MAGCLALRPPDDVTQLRPPCPSLLEWRTRTTTYTAMQLSIRWLSFAGAIAVDDSQSISCDRLHAQVRV